MEFLRLPRKPSGVVMFLAAFFSVCPLAWAELGGGVDSIVANQTHFGATLRLRRLERHQVHELTLPHGTLVREYSNTYGKVFAVTWAGTFRPNLRRLMGEYYEPYIAATRERPAVRGPHRIELPGMVVVMAGHQRALYGKIYLTSSLPEGLLSQDIR
jgi:hypothetical protein